MFPRDDPIILRYNARENPIFGCLFEGWARRALLQKFDPQSRARAEKCESGYFLLVQWTNFISFGHEAAAQPSCPSRLAQVPFHARSKRCTRLARHAHELKAHGSEDVVVNDDFAVGARPFGRAAPRGRARRRHRLWRKKIEAASSIRESSVVVVVVTAAKGHREGGRGEGRERRQ